MRAKRPPQAGFTMIEVMIALLLTAIAIIGIMSLYMSQTRASAYSRHTTEATVLAQDGMEKLRAEGVPASATIATVNEQGVAVAGGLYTRTSTVSALVGSYYDLTVAVSWDENGVPRTIRLYTRRNQ